MGNEPRINFEPFSLDRANECLWRGSQVIKLRPKAYAVLNELVERSGLLVFGEKFASLSIQLTKRDVAILFFVLLAAIGLPGLILHLLLVVTALTLVFALKSR